MKKIIVCLLLAVCCSPTWAQQVAATASSANLFNVKKAAFAWKGTTFDFGKIALNKPVTHTFTFTNSGEEPLVITSVQASCGCTVAEYSKDPIAPGGQGFVKATYNAAKAGVFNKTVTVNANTEQGVVLLTITGDVTP